MHDGGMALFLFLLAFVANLIVGVYSLFLRSQIAAIKEGERKAEDLARLVARLEGSAESYRREVDRLAEDIIERRRKTEELEKKVDALSTQLSIAVGKIDRAASKEAAQGIRGDLGALTERVAGMVHSVDTLAEKIDASTKATEKTTGALERRIERSEEFLHKVRGGS